MGRSRVAVIEDHRLQRRYTVDLLRAQADLDVVYDGECLSDFLLWLKECRPANRPALILLDLQVERGPDADPVVVGKLIDVGYKVLVFSAMASAPLVRRMLEAGVDGVVGKRDTEDYLLGAVRSVLDGSESMTAELAEVIAHDPRRPELSAQEERALVLYSMGATLAEVAESIGVQQGTVKKYLQRVRAKYSNLGRPLGSRVEMSRAAMLDGFVEPPSPHDRSDSPRDDLEDIPGPQPDDGRSVALNLRRGPGANSP